MRLSLRLAVASVLALVLGAASPAGGAIRLLAVGDFGVGGARERAVAEAIQRFESRHPARYLVTLGDNDYTRGTAFEQNWRASYGWLGAAGVRVAGVLGNHDYEVDEGEYELATLGMPARYYTRRVGDVQLFLLDSNRPDALQTAWLKRRLRASTAPWKIAVFHHPPYACGGHLGDSRIRERWSPLFERYGVRLALSGHDHSYQRFASRNDVTYVIHGGGGAPIYPIIGCLPTYPKLEFGRADYGFLSLSADKSRLTVTARDLSGRRVDGVTLRG